MPTFETLPRFEKDWKGLSPQQRDAFRKVVKDAFVPDLMAPDRPFRPGGTPSALDMFRPAEEGREMDRISARHDQAAAEPAELIGREPEIRRLRQENARLTDLLREHGIDPSATGRQSA